MRKARKIKKNEVGSIHNGWEILGPDEVGKDRHRKWLCKCTICNETIRSVDGVKLRGGKSNGCGCDRATKTAAKKIPLTRALPSEDLREKRQFGLLIVLDEPPVKDASNHWTVKCICLCDKKEKPKYYRETKLRNGNVFSCGCEKGREPSSEHVKIGDHFGMWEVVDEYAMQGGHHMFPCKCACGTTKNVRGDHLVRNHSLSCGCAPKLREGVSIGKYQIVNRAEEKIPSALCINTETDETVIVTNDELLQIYAGYKK